MVMAHGQSRHGDRQYRPRRRRREPAARPEQRAGLLRHGLVPARVAGLSPRLRRRDARACSRRCGASSSTPSRACASPTCSTPRVDGTFKGLYVQGEDIVQSDPNTQHVAAGAGGDGMRRRAGPVPERDRELRPCLPAGLVLPGEGRHLHQCRAPHQPRAQGDGAAATAMADWEVTMRARQRAWAIRCTTTIRPRSWTRSRALTPTFAGVSYAKLDELGSVQWPCNEKAPEGTPIMHVDGFVRGKGKFILTEYVRDRRAHRAALPAAADHRAASSASTMSARRRGAPTTSSGTSEDVLEIHPHDAEQRGIRDGDWVRLASRAGETTLRAQITERVRAGRRLHHLPPPGDAGQRHHHRLLRLGDQLPGIQGDGGAGIAVERAVRVAEGL